MSRDDFRARVQEIAGPRGWFQALNPYSNDDPLFNIEAVNYALDDPNRLEPLYVLAVSAKRYALANRRSYVGRGRMDHPQGERPWARPHNRAAYDRPRCRRIPPRRSTGGPGSPI